MSRSLFMAGQYDFDLFCVVKNVKNRYNNASWIAKDNFDFFLYQGVDKNLCTT